MLTVITWKNEYILGHAEIDYQHQRLFEIAAQIYALLRNDVMLDKYDRIAELVTELTEYTEYHFKFEENYMKGSGYKNLLSHKVEHDDFVAKICGVDLCSIDQDHDTFLFELLDFVLGWIRNHILDSDKLIINGR